MVAENFQLLKSKGITHIVNCCGDVCENFWEKEGIQYLKMYLMDSAHEDIICVLYDVIEFIENARLQGKKVLVHCHQGVSRSTIFCIGYLMYLNNKEYEPMYQYVRARRGVVCVTGLG